MERVSRAILLIVALAGGGAPARRPAASHPGQTPPPQARAAPDTEVYLATLSGTGQQIEVGKPENISSNPGYDNQPAFTADGNSVLFTSVRGGVTQSDIYRYDLAATRIAQVTNTPESEYSPTLTPDGGMSVIRVEADGTQRLWRFTLEGRDPKLVLENVKPVGYHAWADDHTLVLFVLGATAGRAGGPPQPATLQVADTRTGVARVAASDIGRSLQPIPGGHTVSFVQRQQVEGKTTLAIKEINPASGAITPLVGAVEGATEADCAWTPDGTLLMAYGDGLYGWRRGWTGWKSVVSANRLGLHGVTRLAVSPSGTRIAIVAAGPSAQ